MKKHLTNWVRRRRAHLVVAAATVGVAAGLVTAPVAHAGSVPTTTAYARTGVRTSSFRVATLNVLGSNHTRARGGYRPGRVRAGGEASLISRRHIGVIGMSEVQPDQYPVLARDLPRYTIWPKGALGRNGYRLQIAWRTSRFKRIAHGSTTYLFSHQRIPMPYVLLRDRRTGARFWVISTHNSPQGQQRARVISTRIEAKVVNRLRSRAHDPVLLLGDLNEHGAAYCRIAASTKMVSANGGRYRHHRCHAPSPSQIDWILGTRKVDFSHYVRSTVTRKRGLSDHPIYYADAKVTSPARR